MQQSYTRNPPTVMAEQFLTDVLPWPANVDDCGEMDGVHVHTSVGLLPVADGDWLVTDQGATLVLPDAEFQAHYTPAA